MTGRRRTGQRSPLHATVLRTLTLDTAGGASRRSILSAGSGLAASGGELYVVADDEQHIGCFALRGAQPGRWLRVLEGDLPLAPRARKKRKADLEVLLRLPALPGFARGALLALGSGSKASRRRGVLLPLDRHGRARGRHLRVDASPLYARLERFFGDLNIEGGWCHAGRLYLLQRGNRGDSPNAIIGLPYAPIVSALAGEQVLPDVLPRHLAEVDLGHIDGVPLGFTDAAVLPDVSWLYSAVAEDTADARADGDFLGAVVGLADADHVRQWQRPLARSFKVEGIDVVRSAGGTRLLAVTDADDPAVAASLLAIAV